MESLIPACPLLAPQIQAIRTHFSDAMSNRRRTETFQFDFGRNYGLTTYCHIPPISTVISFAPTGIGQVVILPPGQRNQI
jgi:hypothetical protein